MFIMFLMNTLKMDEHGQWFLVPKWFNPNVECEYHVGTMGHSTKDYRGFRIIVQELIDNRLLDFEEDPNVINNPLPE